MTSVEQDPRLSAGRMTPEEYRHGYQAWLGVVLAHFSAEASTFGKAERLVRG